MGYDIHITRGASHHDSESAPITLDEWLGLVNSDPEMRLDGVAEATVRGGVVRYTNAGLAVWTAYSKHGLKGNMAWFDHRRGQIIVKNADKKIRPR